MLKEAVYNLDSLSMVLLCALLLLALVIVCKQRRVNTLQSHQLPPTPGLALPLIGHLYLLPKNPRKQMAMWADRLGPIFRVQFGQETLVVLNGLEFLKEALVTNGDYFSGRPNTFVMNALGKNKGFVTSGPHWSQQRKVTMQIFRQLGFGSAVMEEKIQTEVTQFLKHLEAQKGAPFNPRDLTMQCISNVISRLVFGKDFKHENPKMALCARLIGEQVSLMEGMAVLNFLPFLTFLPGDLFGLKKALSVVDQLEQILIKPQIALKKKQDAFKVGEVEDYVTGYLREIDRQKEISSSRKEMSAITEENLVAVVANLFAAGTETTATTICWSFLYLLHHPPVKDRCYQEIVANIGLDRRPCAQDKYRCPYLEAFIMEVQRISSIAPFSLLHVASENVIFRDYLIPKGTIIMPSLDSVLLSHDIWGDPHNFRPERFLDKDKNEVIKRPELLPYSLGRRACLGEAVAKLELFLFLASILQNYDLVLPKGCQLPPLMDRFGLSCSPLPYQVGFLSRSKTSGGRMETG